MNEQDLKEILSKIQTDRTTVKMSPARILNYLGVSRRGWRVVDTINKMFDDYDVFCEPDFGSAWYYGEVEIKPKPKVTAGKSNINSEDTDPTPRLSLLKAANLNKVKEQGEGIGLVTVKAETTLTAAVTLMLQNDFSQLPILNGTRDVDGVISWKSIGRALALKKQCITVSDCKDEVMILNHDEPLFNAVKFVLDREFVLVKQKDKTISGIVTITDIGEQFISMAEPFLIIEQIENHIRKILDQKLSFEDLNSLVADGENTKSIDSLSDLTFGQYVRILEDPKKFEKLDLHIDRVNLVKQLEEVRVIRNDVMHFNPDGITRENLELLRKTVKFFHTLTTTLKM